MTIPCDYTLGCFKDNAKYMEEVFQMYLILKE